PRHETLYSVPRAPVDNQLAETVSTAPRPAARVGCTLAPSGPGDGHLDLTGAVNAALAVRQCLAGGIPQSARLWDTTWRPGRLTCPRLRPGANGRAGNSPCAASTVSRTNDRSLPRRRGSRAGPPWLAA